MRSSSEPLGGGIAAFVPRVTADWLELEPDRRWRRVEGALVFVDISGFTAMSERLSSLGREGAERVTDIIDDAFRALLTHAYDRGGSLLKFGGDALLLLFDDEQAAERAAAAAFEMRAELARFGVVRTPAGTVELRMSAGVHAGAIDLFLVGRSHRELLVLGEGASAVIAVEGDAGAGNILLSDRAAEALPSDVVGEVHGCGRLLVSAPSAPLRPETRRPLANAPHGRAVSTALRHHLADDGRDRAEHRRASVAFVHFDGTDRLIAERGGDAAAVALDELVGVVQDAVDRRELCLLASDIDHDGGKVIITAGVPVAHADDIDRLLLTVREIIEADTEIPVRIGVHGGPLFAGEVGPPYRRTYTVMGDVVNTAARVMSRAEERAILATDEILASAGLRFGTTEVEPFAVKGKTEPLVASQVGAVRDSDATLEGEGVEAVVGRDAELDDLLRRLDAAIAGTGDTVELCGPAGVGKTAVVRALLDRRPAVPSVVLRCHDATSDVPYRPVRAAVLTAFGMSVSVGADEARRGLDAALAPLIGDQLEVIEIAIGVREPAGDVDPATFTVDLAAAIDRLLSTAFPEGVVLIIDGLHWADEGTRTLLEAIASRTIGRRRLVVATTRAEEPQIGGTAFPISPLAENDAVDLVRAASDGRLLPATAMAVARRAEGNPLYVLQLVDALLAGGGDTGEEAVGDLPPTLEGLLAARIDRLAPSERALLRELSVLGPEAELDEIACYLGTDRSLLARRLRRLGGVLTVEPGRRSVRFDDALLADAAYNGLSFRRRRALHRRAASSIESVATDLGARAEDLSRHCSLAGDRAGAWRHSMVAGHRANDRATFRQAATFFRRAVDNGQRLVIDADERAEAYRLLGHASMLGGDYDAAAQAFERASRLAVGPPVRAAVAISRGLLASERSEHVRAIRHLRRGRRILRDHGVDDPRREARALLGEVVVRLTQDRIDEAGALAGAALECAERADDDLLVANACTWLLQIGNRARDPEAVSFGRRATALYEAHGRRRHLAHVDNAVGVLLFEQGEWVEAERHLRRAIETLDDLGLPSEASRGRLNLGFRLDLQHRFAEAAELFGEARRLFDLVDHPLAPYAGGMAAAARVRAGEAAGAADEFRQAIDALLASPMAAGADDVRLAWAEAMVTVGEVAEATEALGAVADPNNDEFVVRSPRLRGRVALACGDEVAAASFADDAIAAARAAGDEYQLGLAYELRADVAGPGAGDDARAEAEAILARFGVRSLATAG